MINCLQTIKKILSRHTVYARTLPFEVAIYRARPKDDQRWSSLWSVSPGETEDALSRSGGNHGGRCGSSLYQVVQPIAKEGHPLWITTENDTEEDEKTVSVLFSIFLFPCLVFVFFFFFPSLNSDLILESS
jgi:hypothetical protein